MKGRNMLNKFATSLIFALGLTIVDAPGLTLLHAAEMMVNGGKMVGVSGHQAGGTVAIVKDGDVTKLVLKADFNLQAAPDAKLGFGKDGYIKGTIFSKLKKIAGAQEYVIPASVDLSKYNEVWVWCEKFNVPLGMAKLN